MRGRDESSRPLCGPRQSCRENMVWEEKVSEGERETQRTGLWGTSPAVKIRGVG